MKKLKTLALSRLSVLEFGQHIKSVCESFSQVSDITDEMLHNYIYTLINQMTDYNRATLVISKSDETAKIVAADKERDLALSAAIRMLSVYEFATETNEKDAFASLTTVFNTYKGIQTWNFEEETNGIDNLIDDLNEPKYSNHINLLNMGAFVTRVQTTNNAFKNLFSSRIYESASKEVFDMKAMRRDIKTVYEDMVNYIFAMAKAQNTDQFNNSLNNINALRKYYSDMLARQNGKSSPAEKPSTSQN